MYGRKYEVAFIVVYEMFMKYNYKNFRIIKCGFVVYKDLFFLYIILDFLMLCFCCGDGCGEVKCIFFIENYCKKDSFCFEMKEENFYFK